MVGLYENRQAVGGATDPQLHSNRTVIHFKREYLVQLYYTNFIIRGGAGPAPRITYDQLLIWRAAGPAAPTGTIDTTIPVVQSQLCWLPSAVVSAGKCHFPAPPCSRK